MTDKTSTAPVMPYSAAEAASMIRTVIEDILAQAKGTHETAHEFVSWHLPRIRSLMQWIDAHLNAPTPDVVGGDVVVMLQAGFITACSHGPDKDYRLNIKFPTLAALQTAHNALVMAAPRVQGDAVVTALRECADVLREMRIAFPDPDRKVYRSASDALAKLDAALAAQPKGDGHPDDVAVDAFAETLKDKLAEARAKGRGGWNSEEPRMQQRLSDMLRAHVEKGDPRDVANFAMFLHQRGEAILPAEQTRGNGCPCEPSGSDGLACPGTDGRLLCDPKHKPEQTRGDGDHSDAIELLRAYQSNFGSIKPDDADEASVWERIEKACRQLDVTRQAVPREWLSEQVGGEFDDLTAGQGYRRGWNDCRKAMLAAPSAGRMGVES